MSSPNAQAAWGILTANMSHADQQQLQSVLEYMHERASDPSGYVGEGGIPALINRQSPAVRKALGQISELMETPRNRPFMEKWSEHQNADAMGLDPQTSVTIKQALDTSDVISGTIDRLGGSDATVLPPEEPSTRDVMSAAFDKFSGEQP
jgi:hypothetical protein